jgi:DNA polymerase-3 subunit gamma/tau
LIDTGGVEIAQDKLEQWYGLVAQLSIGGVAKMIAEHSVPEVLEASSIHLVLSAEHDTLLSEAQRANLARALEQSLGREVALEIRVGMTPFETPAQRRGRLQAERQAAAEIAMQEDENVRALLAEFDGQLEEVRLH